MPEGGETDCGRRHYSLESAIPLLGKKKGGVLFALGDPSSVRKKKG